MATDSADDSLSDNAFEAEEAPTSGTQAIQSSLERQLTALAKLSASVAHEIRTPLNAARLKLALLEEELEQHTASSRDVATAMQFVSREIARASALLDEFLKLPVWRPLKRSVSSFRRSLERVVLVCCAEADALSVRFSASIDLDFQAWMDHERIERALIDLVQSALRAAGSAGHVQLSAHEAKGLVTVVIERDGPPATTGLDDLFSPRQVIVAHGGDIRVERLGDRTVFEVLLPRMSGRSSPRAQGA